MHYRLRNIDNKTITDIVAAIAAIPATVTTLDLSWTDLYNKTGAELAFKDATKVETAAFTRPALGV